MNYDFDSLIDRRGTNSMKWDEDSRWPDLLPMWVADMDFRAAPCIVDALRRRVDHGVFGYCFVPSEFYEATITWMSRRHGLTLQRDWFIYTSGVVPAISAIIKAIARPGDGVAVMTPVYNCFFSSIRNNGCRIVESPLIYADSTYTIDYADLESRLADPRTTVMLLCNPHNPACRVWTRAELERVAEMCRRHGVKIISDEIHCELTYPGHDYTPMATVDPDTVTCLSPSKAFNIAGLQIANIICADPDVRARIDRAINDNEVCDVNPFGVDALIAAYTRGEQWLDQLRVYLFNNYLTVRAYLAENLPQIGLATLEGTYLLWLDIRATGLTSEQFQQQLLESEHLWLTAGTVYGAAGQGFIRMNIACPRSRILDALARLNRFLSLPIALKLNYQ